MNYRMILSLLGDVLLVIGAFLLLPCIVAVIYGEPELWVLLATAAGSGLLGGLFILLRPKRRRELHARDGFVMVALSWILISLVGAIPFTVSGAIPSYLDAVFETMSGFTTTGASILRAVEDLPKCLLFWRSFTHWLGGMGVLVFMLAIVPLSGESIYLLRAESPGPSVSKMVPKMRTSAAILYAIYCAMTLLQILFYRLGVLFGWGEITWFDSLCLSFGTAGDRQLYLSPAHRTARAECRFPAAYRRRQPRPRIRRASHGAVPLTGRQKYRRRANDRYRPPIKRTNRLRL